ncbi:hypothetical protein C8034_v003723 [Colletotrichum sidae]|uniref:Uncharacterized protein n=1 Tax=Colletotrichum sidae TaxID=1347389 RepID=A0A4R8T9E8_9PEZI|nr:hypothetical protein C8034_v003723 [Colletotrichum sidae]
MEGGTTKWIGVDPSNIAVTVVTATRTGRIAVATITKGVTAEKNGSGGLRILLSPAVKAKLESLAKQVTPCAGKRRRQILRRQVGQSCGLSDFVQRVGADSELQANFAEPLTDQVWHQIDEGYESGHPGEDGGWEGDGGPGEDEGYFSDDGQGFFEGSEEGGAETIVFSTTEEAVAIGEALSGSQAVVNAAVWGGSTVTAGSFLARIWPHVSKGLPIANAHEIPKEGIQRVTKVKASSTKISGTTTTTTSSASCATGKPSSCNNCKPTSTEVKEAKATGVVDWICSEGESKGCICDPEVTDAATIYDVNFNQAVLNAVEHLSKDPEQPITDCPGGISNVPSKFIVEKTSRNFCNEVMKDLSKELADAGTAYDINGNKVTRLKMSKAMEQTVQSKRSLSTRTPPERSDSYRDYRFYFSYMPKGGNGEIVFEAVNRFTCSS